jgi:hypothetical protein
MIYISLCSVPDRLLFQESSEKCLLALLNQDTVESYVVLLNIPLNFKNYEYFEIPSWLLNLQRQYLNKLYILRDEIDYGPISNILSSIKLIDMNSEDIIIVCDDDHIYEKNMISYHLLKLQEYPNNHSICFRGNHPIELRTWYENDKKYGKFYPSCVLFPTRNDIYLKLPDHWHSVSYRRKFLENDIFDPEFLNITWNNDILMGIYAWTHNFYFLCSHYKPETDFRPVNYDGRGSSSFPIKISLPVHINSGCNRWREKNKLSGDIYDIDKLNKLLWNNDKGIINL